MHTDKELRQCLKNWAAGQPLPELSSRELIQAAKEQRIRSENSAALSLTEFSANLLSVPSINSVDNRIVNLRPI